MRSGIDRRERRRILVYCGGSRTEPDYLDGLRRALTSGAVTAHVRQKGVSPQQLVQVAAAFTRRSKHLYAEVWCVVDVDDFDLDTTMRSANAAGVKIAVSNPCFELWLLLHHDECRAHQARCSSVVRRLREQVPNYDKTQLSFADFALGVREAIRRAKALDGGEKAWPNPSTGMWRLIEVLMGGGDEVDGA